MADRVRSNRGADAYDKLNELSKLVGVDKLMLDDNLEQQPDLYYRVATEYELAKSAADIAETTIKELEAVIDKEIRGDAAATNEKLTEPEIKRRITDHVDMRASVTDMQKKKEIAGRWNALRGAYDQRSHSMKGLVGLHTSGYFSNATSSSARRDDRERRADESGTARTRTLREQRGTE